jgi:hypothetical protein
MEKTVIKLYDVVSDKDLSQISVDKMPSEGEPIEIEGDLYFVCELDNLQAVNPAIGVIPLIVRNPAGISNIGQYLKCLSKAHRSVKFRNEKGPTDLEQADEMIIL